MCTCQLAAWADRLPSLGNKVYFAPPLTLGHGCSVLLVNAATISRCQRLVEVPHRAE